MDLIDILQWVALAGVLVRIEGFTAKRLKKNAKALHKENSEKVVQDTNEQLDRLVHLIKNHVSGPAHRR